MNLPSLNDIQTSRSTYYTLSKANKDFDKSTIENTKYYFTKMVALRLPVWSSETMFFDWSIYDSENNPNGNLRYYPSTAPIPELSTPNNMNPNKVIARCFQYYMENIIRHTNISNSGANIEQIGELAFWKTLKLMGLTESYIHSGDCVKFMNRINVSNFYNVSNNHGWAEIVAAIPNKCKHLNMNVNGVWKTIIDVDDVVNAQYDDACLYDNGDLSFNFVDFKKVLDFDFIDIANNSHNVFDEVNVVDFDFNVLLLFYTDASGVEKLHGINFINGFVQNTISNYEMNNYNHKSNEIQTFGYTFRFNMKSNNNQATISEVYDAQEGSFYNEFGETLGKLNSFLNKVIE